MVWYQYCHKLIILSYLMIILPEIFIFQNENTMFYIWFFYSPPNSLSKSGVSTRVRLRSCAGDTVQGSWLSDLDCCDSPKQLLLIHQGEGGGGINLVFYWQCLTPLESHSLSNFSEHQQLVLFWTLSKINPDLSLASGHLHLSLAPGHLSCVD